MIDRNKKEVIRLSSLSIYLRKFSIKKIIINYFFLTKIFSSFLSQFNILISKIAIFLASVDGKRLLPKFPTLSS